MRIYIDSDVLIWHLRGDRKALHFLRAIRADHSYELWTGAMQRAEIVFFMRPEEEKPTELLLSQFKTATVDQPIIDLAGGLYRRWHPSHGMYIHDATLSRHGHENGRGYLYP